MNVLIKTVVAEFGLFDGFSMATQYILLHINSTMYANFLCTFSVHSRNIFVIISVVSCSNFLIYYDAEFVTFRGFRLSTEPETASNT